MSSIYQGICSNCGYETITSPTECGAVLVAQPVKNEEDVAVGKILASEIFGEKAIVQGDQLVVLMHPLEESIMKGTGYTLKDLFQEGRYVRITFVICQQCATVFAKRHLGLPMEFGCLVSIIAGICGASVGFFMQSPVIGILVCTAFAFVGIMGTDMASRIFLEYRFRDRARAFVADQLCPKCGANDSVQFDSAKNIRCPGCNEESLNVDMVGIS